MRPRPKNNGKMIESIFIDHKWRETGDTGEGNRPELEPPVT